MIGDTDPSKPLFADDEVNAALQITSSQNLYISGPGAFGTARMPIVPQVYSVYQAAAVLLRAMAANAAFLSGVIELLDVKLSQKEAAKALRDTADDWCKFEQSQGSFAIAELVNDQFSARERIWKSLLRLYPG